MTRINVKIRAAEETDINGPGPAVREEAFAELLRKISRLPAGAVLVLAGSMPHSLPEGACGQIFSAAESMRVVADLPAAGLREVLAYRPWLVKPNREEAEALFGTPVLTRGDGLACAHRLCEEGARNAIVSLGALGAVMVSEEGCEYEVPVFSGKAVDTVGARRFPPGRVPRRQGGRPRRRRSTLAGGRGGLRHSLPRRACPRGRGVCIAEEP